VNSKSWKLEEIKQFNFLLEKRLTFVEIAKEMNRTQKSVSSFAYKNGIHNPKERPSVFLNCLQCNKIFESKKQEKRKFCSHSCSTSYQNTHKTGVVNSDSIF